MRKSYACSFQTKTYVDFDIRNCVYFIGCKKVRSGFILSDISLYSDNDEKPVSLRNEESTS